MDHLNWDRCFKQIWCFICWTTINVNIAAFDFLEVFLVFSFLFFGLHNKFVFWIYRAFADEKAPPLGKSKKLVERGLHLKLTAPASSEVNSYSMFTCVNCCYLFLFTVVAFFIYYRSRVQRLVLDKTAFYADSIAYLFIFTHMLLY